jgi:hypothetical protein
MSILFALVFIFIEVYLKELERGPGFIFGALNCCVTYNREKLERICLSVLQKKNGKSCQLYSCMMGYFEPVFRCVTTWRNAHNKMLNEKKHSKYFIYNMILFC